MGKNTAAAAVVVVILALIAFGAYYLSQVNSKPSPITTQQYTSVQTTAIASQAGTAFNSTSYFANSYLIYPGNLSSAAKKALGAYTFHVSAAANGSTILTLVYPHSVNNKTFSIPSGYRFYYIENSLGDDSAQEDLYPTDDGYAIVNASGYLITASVGDLYNAQAYQTTTPQSTITTTASSSSQSTVTQTPSPTTVPIWG